MIVLVTLVILNKELLLVQLVTINVILVKDLPLIVLNVTELELQPQVVHVQIIIMKLLIKLVNNVVTYVHHVLVTLVIVIHVGLHKIPITENYLLLVVV
jgi:hypothetical protein